MPSFENEVKTGLGLKELKSAVSSLKREGIAVGKWELRISLRRSTSEERSKATAAVLRAAASKKR